MIISSVAVVQASDLFPKFEQNMSDSYTWQIAVIGGFMSVAAVIALMSLIIRKSS